MICSLAYSIIYPVRAFDDAVRILLKTVFCFNSNCNCDQIQFAVALLDIHITSEVAVFAFLALVNASPLTTFGKLPPRKEELEEEYILPAVQSSDTTDSYQIHQPQVPLDLQLPNVERNPVPFNIPEPVSYLRVPQESQEPNYYEVPIPNQDLVAPVATEWNPDNDPKYYYEVPVVLTRQELPTKQYPKKFIEDIHLKKKPYSTKPKQELVLQPIDEKLYEQRQNDLQKRFESIAKNENKKVIKMLRPRKKAVEQQAAASEFADQHKDESFDQDATGSSGLRKEIKRGLLKAITVSTISKENCKLLITTPIPMMGSMWRATPKIREKMK
ncbi:uncharacterized protein isoform X3 [Leptinotarsa decemlineata]|uniref:uncharacterized protein isoform X3 n=1 Tax=Leptinotarsa decemlineata TaxID=7539 RepID=UPI003D304B1F